MSGTREENLFMARLAEQAERYEDMIEYMKRVAQMGSELNLEERNLLSVAYKNCVGSLRMAWRVVGALANEYAKENPAIGDLIQGFRTKVEADLNSKCSDILEILSKDLIEKASDAEAKVFFTKLKGDYYRYMAEFNSGSVKADCAKEALDAYTSANELAEAKLNALHPLRLGLALNFSVFYNEVYASPEQACQLAKKAYDEACKSTVEFPEDQYQESTQILQLLRDNLQLWTSDMQPADGSKAPEEDGTAVQDL